MRGTGIHLGSLFFEEMSCCGYDPQRRQFACPVKINQPFGFGAAPLPGSREHVLHCVRMPPGYWSRSVMTACISPMPSATRGRRGSSP